MVNHLMLDSKKVIEILELHTSKWMLEELKDIPHVAEMSIEVLIQGLHSCNFYSWKADDRSRGNLDPKIIVQHKRNLDASNLMRNHFMEAIDSLTVDTLQLRYIGDYSSLILNSETIGQMLDRMSVLTLKKSFLDSRLSSIDASDAQKRVNQQLSYVQECYDLFLQKLQRKEAYMLAYKQYKMYKPDVA